MWSSERLEAIVERYAITRSCISREFESVKRTLVLPHYDTANDPTLGSSSAWIRTEIAWLFLASIKERSAENKK